MHLHTGLLVCGTVVNMTSEQEYFEKLAALQGAYPQVAQDLADKGWQVVWCPQNEDGEWTPLQGTTGRYDFPTSLTQPGSVSRIAFRPPESVIILDVDHYAHKLGHNTIERAEESLCELPATWKVTSRGAGNPSGRYLYRIPASTDTRTFERSLKFFGEDQPGGGKVSDVEVVRTGHRFSWAPLDVNPKNSEIVQVYAPDGSVTSLPWVNELPALPEEWLDFFRDPPVVAVPQPQQFNTEQAEWWKHIPDGSLGHRDDLARLGMDLLYVLPRDEAIDELKRVSLALDPAHPWRPSDFNGFTDANTQEKVSRRMAEWKEIQDFTCPDPVRVQQKVDAARRKAEQDALISSNTSNRVAIAIEQGLDMADERTREFVIAGIQRDESGEPERNFDPQDTSDQGLAWAVLDRINGARYCTDSKYWLVWKSGTDPWTEEDDIIPWVIAKLADAMPYGEPAPSDDDEEGPAKKRQFKNRQYLRSAKGASAVSRKVSAFLAVSDTHQASYKRGNVDTDPDVIWAAGQCYDIRKSLHSPVLAPKVDPTRTPHLMTASVAPRWDGSKTAQEQVPGFMALCEAILPDPVARDYWLDMLALGITGYSSKRTIPLAVGATKSGKTLLLQRMPFGTYMEQVSGMDLLSGSDREEARRLNLIVGRRLPYIDEGIPKGTYAMARLKKISNGVGKLPARGLYGKEFAFTPTHTLVMLVNPEEEPSYEDDAVKDRVCRVEFGPVDPMTPQAVTDEHQGRVKSVADWYDPDKQQWKDETAGVLAFMIMRAAQILKDDSMRGTSFTKPESLSASQEGVAAQENPVLAWVTQCTSPVQVSEAGEWDGQGMDGSVLYDHYLEWSKLRKGAFTSQIGFGRKLSKLGIPSKRPGGVTHYAVKVQQAWAQGLRG